LTPAYEESDWLRFFSKSLTQKIEAPSLNSTAFFSLALFSMTSRAVLPFENYFFQLCQCFGVRIANKQPKKLKNTFLSSSSFKTKKRFMLLTIKHGDH